MNATLYENEHIEYLSEKTPVIVSDEHTFGTDALLLASFASPKSNDVICDLGAGCGIIPFIFLRDGNRKITAVEIQENACDQIKRSVEMNNAEDKITLINSDLKELDFASLNGRFSLVTMNPPYTKAQGGIESEKKSEKIARHETMCDISDVALCASKILKYGGRLCVCGRPERLFETMKALSDKKIEPKRLRMVQKNTKSAPWLFLLEGRLGGKSGMTVSSPLYIENDDGEESDELLSILGKYREETV
ncbi:MAG: methyltransferase [Clostridia bacterium]|nr:methyltransferase [Clostridia bacterium]